MSAIGFERLLIRYLQAQGIPDTGILLDNPHQVQIAEKGLERGMDKIKQVSSS
jgi:hypothetical protein